MRPDPDWQDDASPARPPVLKIVGRFVAGWLTGSILSLCYINAFLRVFHISPQQPATTGVLWAVAIGGIIVTALFTILGAGYYRPQALSIGAAIAATIAGVSMYLWFSTPQAAHWTQAIAVFLMAPAAQFAALARRED